MKQKIQLSESQLRKLIKESVKKALVNEISSDMIGRAMDKFKEKYYTPIMDKSGKKLGYFNPGSWTHPKDKRLLSSHERDFEEAFEKAKKSEHPEIYQKAMELSQELSDSNFEVGEIKDSTGDGSGDHYAELFAEVKDENGGTWSFYTDYGVVSDNIANYGNYGIESIGEYLNFTTPDGFEGEIPYDEFKQTVKLNESQLRKLIKESVKKAIMNEISSDMMRNARDKFGDTYGPKWVDDKDNPMGPKDHQFYPLKMQYKPTKDGKDFSIHMKNFNDAIVKSEAEEIKNLSDEELANRAEEIWDRYSKDADFDEYERDGGKVYGTVTLEVDGWEFAADGSGFGHRDYNLDWDVVGDSVDFTAPDGRSGSFSI